MSPASEVEPEEPGGKSLSHLQLLIARRPSIVILGLEACDRMSFHGFTTYWMIKKASLCTVHCVENTAGHKKYSVLPGEADQTSQVGHSGAVLRNLTPLLPAALEVQRTVNRGRQFLIGVGHVWLNGCQLEVIVKVPPIRKEVQAKELKQQNKTTETEEGSRNKAADTDNKRNECQNLLMHPVCLVFSAISAAAFS